MDYKFKYQVGERVIFTQPMHSHGVIKRCLYFPPSNPGAISMARYNIDVKDLWLLKGIESNLWFDESEFEIDKEHYRDEKLKEILND